MTSYDMMDYKKSPGGSRWRLQSAILRKHGQKIMVKRAENRNLRRPRAGDVSEDGTKGRLACESQIGSQVANFRELQPSKSWTTAVRIGTG
jgi:hypothetical protein